MPSRDKINNCHAHFFGADAGTVRAVRQPLFRWKEFNNRRLLMSERFSCRPEFGQDRFAFPHIGQHGGSTLHAMLATQFARGQLCPERDSTPGDWSITS